MHLTGMVAVVGLTLLREGGRGGETSSHIWAPSPQPGFALVKMCDQRLNAKLSHSSESVKTWSANQDTQMFGKQDGVLGMMGGGWAIRDWMEKPCAN